MATSGASVRLKRLRQRFGIGAPRLAIKAHVAWYWRAVFVFASIAVSLALAAWMYDAGMRIAGFHSEASSREIQSLRDHVMELDAELTKLRSLAGVGESNIQIERAALRQLSEQVRSLEDENSVLKEDLALFERLIPSSVTDSGDGVRIDRLRIAATGAPGGYRYRMLVVNGGGRLGKEVKGMLRLVVKVRQGGRDSMFFFPSDLGRDAESFRFVIKNFDRLEGEFALPLDASIKSVEVILQKDGAVLARQVAIL